MKSVRRWRHYCDFCKKSGSQKPAMKEHEAVCTLNPNRTCRMCNITSGGDSLENLIKLCESFEIDEFGAIKNEQKALEKLYIASGNCPNCILAALRQSKRFLNNFDYQKELKSFWNEFNIE